jgi:phage-related minor tail protein
VINGPTAIGGGGSRNQRGTILSGPAFLGDSSNITPTANLGIAGEAGPEAILPLAKTSAGLGVRAIGMGGGGSIINNTKIIMIKDVSRSEMDDLIDQVDSIDASIEERSASQAASILLGAG